MKSNFLIGATNSGCGKTTITVGLLRALKNKGFKVQPFKCGPDYIDTQYHRLAAGADSINLDTWLASNGHVGRLFQHYGSTAEVSIAEGVMGLFDGFNRMQGSSAHVAQITGLPVVLIVNAKSMAYSAPPLLYGYLHYCKDIHMAGVIFNQVGSGRHAQLLESACKDVGLQCFGMVPKMRDMEIPSRHLGLTLENTALIERIIEKAAQTVQEHINLDALLEATAHAASSPSTHTAATFRQPLSTKDSFSPSAHPKNRQRIAVACDEAFNFVYRENIDRLHEWGEVSFFSPIHDGEMPPADFLYLPGGYPEFFLPQLSNNQSMLQSVRTHIEQGGRTLAECGGMMYLCSHIIDAEGLPYPMVGVLKQKATMQGMRLHLGYRHFRLNGAEWKGHEFHYSTIMNQTTGAPPVADTIQYDAQENPASTPIYIYKNLLATYTHLYWGNQSIFNLF